ncbi:hypothetical protein [Klebsiella phage phiKp_21]|nr:hypothetical protein [Klebsiella phage phiKp_21]
MKTIIFFVLMMICSISARAELIVDMVCVSNDGEYHTYKVDRDNLLTILIDNIPYDYEKNTTIGDTDISKYANTNNKSELAYIAVDVYEDMRTKQQFPEIKLVLMENGAKVAKFGGLCHDN